MPVRYCLTCSYDLSGLRECTCPECGRAFDPDDPRTYRPAAEVPREVRAWRWALCVANFFMATALYNAACAIGWCATTERWQPDILVCSSVAAGLLALVTAPLAFQLHSATRRDVLFIVLSLLAFHVVAAALIVGVLAYDFARSMSV